MRNQFVHLAVVLMLISGLASGALALVNSFTEPRIKAAKEAALAQALSEALPGASDFKPDEAYLQAARKADPSFAVVRSLYRAVAADGSPAGIVIVVAPRGYSSEIETAIGIGQNGRIAAVRVLAQSETPGLGSKVAEADFLRGFFKARAGEEQRVNKDGGKVVAVTGATISSRAVARGVSIGLALAKRAGL